LSYTQRKKTKDREKRDESIKRKRKEAIQEKVKTGLRKGQRYDKSERGINVEGNI
jgi:hypothetical protein